MPTNIPTTLRGIDGKAAYERIINGIPKERETNLETKVNLEPQQFNLDIVKSDYIQIPNQNYVIAIGETNFNLNYEEAHKKTLEQGLVIPKPIEFMNFHNHIIDSYKNKKTIFDAAGNPISENTKNDLYKKLTSNCWTWLNGEFKISENEKKIEYILGLDKNNNFIKLLEDLEPFLASNGYIDFTKLTKDGLGMLNHSIQSYEKGENIYFWSPINEGVAWFLAGSDRAYLSADSLPSCRYPGLGVRAAKQRK